MPLTLASARLLGRREFAQELHALLFPEEHPPGTPYHDPEHVYWQGQHLSEPAFQWSSETIVWVAEKVKKEL